MFRTRSSAPQRRTRQLSACARHESAQSRGGQAASATAPGDGAGELPPWTALPKPPSATRARWAGGSSRDRGRRRSICRAERRRARTSRPAAWFFVQFAAMKKGVTMSGFVGTVRQNSRRSVAELLNSCQSRPRRWSVRSSILPGPSSQSRASVPRGRGHVGGRWDAGLYALGRHRCVVRCSARDDRWVAALIVTGLRRDRPCWRRPAKTRSRAGRRPCREAGHSVKEDVRSTKEERRKVGDER